MDANTIRKARKKYRCDFWKGDQGRCANIINVGDSYVEGELDETALMDDSRYPFQHLKYCMDCAGPEARQSLADATEATQ